MVVVVVVMMMLFLERDRLVRRGRHRCVRRGVRTTTPLRAIATAALGTLGLPVHRRLTYPLQPSPISLQSFFVFFFVFFCFFFFFFFFFIACLLFFAILYL